MTASTTPRRPGFFIVGMPKCGTCALALYLGEHPNVFMCTPKEPGYFSDRIIDQYRSARTERDYLALFTNATSEHLTIGEATTRYSLYPESLWRIQAFNPNARIILMVRNPIDAAASLHARQYRGGDENEPDFETAWALQDPRKQGHHMPPNCREPLFLQYHSTVTQADTLQRILEVFPRDQVKVVVMEDLKTDARRLYQDVLAFLNVPDDGRTTFDPVNENTTLKSQWLAKWTHHPPKPIQALATMIRQKTGIAYFGLGGPLAKLHQWNAVKQKRPALRPEFRSQLAEAFADDVHALGTLIGRDLSGWLEQGCKQEARVHQNV